MKLSLRTLFVLCAVIAIVLAIDRGIDRHIRNTYRLSITAYVLRCYLEGTDKWPDSWESIRQYINENPSEFTSLGSIDDLENNITIDFAFAPSSIDWDAYEAQGKQLRVVFTTNGQTAGATGSPNDVVLEYYLGKRRNGLNDR